MDSSPAAQATASAADVHTDRLPAGQTVAHAPLYPSPEGISWVRISPRYVNRALLEVACRL